MSLNVRVITPDKVIWDADTEELILPSSTGQLGILADHAPLLTARGRVKEIGTGSGVGNKVERTGRKEREGNGGKHERTSSGDVKRVIIGFGPKP
jgi:hypothetical protein